MLKGIKYTAEPAKTVLQPTPAEAKTIKVLRQDGVVLDVYSELEVSKLLGYVKKNMYRLRVRGYLPPSPLKIDPCAQYVYTKEQVDVARKELNKVKCGQGKVMPKTIYDSIKSQWESLGIYTWTLSVHKEK